MYLLDRNGCRNGQPLWKYPSIPIYNSTTELITVEIQKYLESEMDSKRRICNSLELSTAYPQVGKLPQNAFSS